MRYINFDNIPENREWAFESVRSTEQWTHGYHRYPAKFLPDVVRKIIEDHGGYIWATSRETEGTCMHFVLRKYVELPIDKESEVIS